MGGTRLVPGDLGGDADPLLADDPRALGYQQRQDWGQRRAGNRAGTAVARKRWVPSGLDRLGFRRHRACDQPAHSYQNLIARSIYGAARRKLGDREEQAFGCHCE